MSINLLTVVADGPKGPLFAVGDEGHRAATGLDTPTQCGKGNPTHSSVYFGLTAQTHEQTSDRPSPAQTNTNVRRQDKRETTATLPGYIMMHDSQMVGDIDGQRQLNRFDFSNFFSPFLNKFD